VQSFLVYLTLIVSGIAVILIFGPLVLRGGVRLSGDAAGHLAYFAILGGGFMLVEIGLVHRLSLMLGNPGLSLAVVLGGLIVSSGVGSLTSQRERIPPPRLAVYLVIYVGAFLLTDDLVIRMVLRWPTVARAAFAFLWVAPTGLMMGQFFPVGLARCAEDDARLVPWAWGVNGATGTVVACAAPLLAQQIGFTALLGLGALAYALIPLLPRYRRI
jgi:hypothetical protein